MAGGPQKLRMGLRERVTSYKLQVTGYRGRVTGYWLRGAMGGPGPRALDVDCRFVSL